MQGKEIKSLLIGKNVIKPCLLANDLVIYTENFKAFTKVTRTNEWEVKEVLGPNFGQYTKEKKSPLYFSIL